MAGQGGKTGSICAVPGCGRALWRYAVSGVCRTHNHHVRYCQCADCSGRRSGRDMPTGGSETEDNRILTGGAATEARRIMIDGDEPEACRRMWIAVACIVVTDAAAVMAKARMSGDADRIAAVMLREECYFRSRDWRDLAALAGVSCKPEAVMDFLRSDRVGVSQHAVQLSHGLVDGKSRGQAKQVAA